MNHVKQMEIVGWLDLYETSETRKLKELRWVAVPNRHDGFKFNWLLAHENGPAHYAAWILLLQVASKSQPRGVIPWNARIISRMTGLAEQIILDAAERLMEIGWIKELEESPSLPGNDPGKPVIVEKGRVVVENGITLSPPADAGSEIQSETTTTDGRGRLFALLTMYGATTTMKGEDIFAEWCNACSGYSMDWIEHLFRAKRQRPELPSKLRKVLRRFDDEHEAWKQGRQPAQAEAAT